MRAGLAPRFTADRERELASERPPGRFVPGDPDWGRWMASAARRDLILSVAPLAMKIAARFASGPSGDDAIGVALLGAVEAVDRFDPALGWRLTSYAGRWVHGRLVTHATCQGGVIRIGQHGRWPERRGHVNHETLEAVRRAMAVVPIGRECRDEVAAPEPDDGEAAEERRGRVRAAVDRLPKGQAAAIRARFWREDGRVASHAEVGRDLGVTREWARIMGKEALERLRRELRAESRD